jgi:hypothetical protein
MSATMTDRERRERSETARVGAMADHAKRVAAMDALHETQPDIAASVEINLRNSGRLDVSDHRGWRAWMAANPMPEEVPPDTAVRAAIANAADSESDLRADGDEFNADHLVEALAAIGRLEDKLRKMELALCKAGASLFDPRLERVNDAAHAAMMARPDWEPEDLELRECPCCGGQLVEINRELLTPRKLNDTVLMALVTAQDAAVRAVGQPA